MHSAKLFQKSRNHLKILGGRRLTRSKFHTEDSQILGTIIQDLVTTATWHPAFVHPGLNVPTCHIKNGFKSVYSILI
jgi:hypothetical protein